MAKLTAGSRIFMLYMNDSNLPFVVRDGVVTSSTSTIFEVVEQISSNSSETATLTGVGFANYQDGYPSAGIINGLTWKSNNSLIYGLEDISISVQELRAFLQSGDIQGLFKHLYRGADTITGSSADDALLGFAGNDILIGRGGMMIWRAVSATTLTISMAWTRSMRGKKKVRIAS